MDRSKSPIPDNEWHLYSSVYNRLTGFLKLYIDDVLVADTIVNNGSLANCNTYSSMVGSTTPSNIILDELAIFDYAYTEYDIQQITCSFQSSVLDHIFAYWNFNEGQGNTVYDLSGNENHGTINGASYSTDTSGDNCE